MLRLVRDTHANSGSPSPIADTLMGLHEHWLSKLRQLVAGLLAADASVPERRAVRLEFDEALGRWYRGELELARALMPLFVPEAVSRLERAERAIERLRHDIGRLVPSPESMAPLRETVLDLLDALQLWCAELELAVTDLAVGQLSTEGRALLQRLDADR